MVLYDGSLGGGGGDPVFPAAVYCPPQWFGLMVLVQQCDDQLETPTPILLFRQYMEQSCIILNKTFSVQILLICRQNRNKTPLEGRFSSTRGFSM